MKFKNPNNSYTVTSDYPFAGTLFFGCFYFARHGAWGPAVIAFIVSVLSAGVAWIIYPFFAENIIRNSYLQKGWIEVESGTIEKKKILPSYKIPNWLDWLDINPMSKTQFIVFMSAVAITLLSCLTVIFPAIYQ